MKKLQKDTRQKKGEEKKTKRQNDKRQRPKREFNIATSGQFRTLAMFLHLSLIASVYLAIKASRREVFFILRYILDDVICHFIFHKSTPRRGCGTPSTVNRQRKQIDILSRYSSRMSVTNMSKFCFPGTFSQQYTIWYFTTPGHD